jgi:uncharacterized membrane protein YedE/YeeE
MKTGILAALASGALFGCGLAISGMTDRRVVLGFLDLAGDFNPALAFVMAGAVAVTATAPADRKSTRLNSSHQI